MSAAKKAPVILIADPDPVSYTHLSEQGNSPSTSRVTVVMQYVVVALSSVTSCSLDASLWLALKILVRRTGGPDLGARFRHRIGTTRKPT